MSVLLDLRNYVREHKSTSLLDLSNKFRMSPEAVRGMMQHWEQKGLVRQQNDDTSCGGCVVTSGCQSCMSQITFERYIWVG